MKRTRGFGVRFSRGLVLKRFRVLAFLSPPLCKVPGRLDAIFGTDWTTEEIRSANQRKYNLIKDYDRPFSMLLGPLVMRALRTQQFQWPLIQSRVPVRSSKLRIR